MKRLRFYVCPICGSFVQGNGNSKVLCCGNQLDYLKAEPANDKHIVQISEIENDYYIKFNPEMTKEPYISFVSYVMFDRVLTVKLYPEQNAEIRLPRMYKGKLYFYCNKHGLFEKII